jgi:(p)ppGpp synthase/HD superfamily hydrolase
MNSIMIESIKNIFACSEMSNFNKALALLAIVHGGQKDKGGKDYSKHPLKVMYYLKSDDDELQQIALLHDVVEDHGKYITYALLRELGFSERVIEGVRSVTKIAGETEEEYKAKVKANIDGIKVKMADLRHNTDIRRLKGIRQKDIERTIKYRAFYLELEECLKQKGL